MMGLAPLALMPKSGVMLTLGASAGPETPKQALSSTDTTFKT